MNLKERLEQQESHIKGVKSQFCDKLGLSKDPLPSFDTIIEKIPSMIYTSRKYNYIFNTASLDYVRQMGAYVKALDCICWAINTIDSISILRYNVKTNSFLLPLHIPLSLNYPIILPSDHPNYIFILSYKTKAIHIFNKNFDKVTTWELNANHGAGIVSTNVNGTTLFMSNSDGSGGIVGYKFLEEYLSFYQLWNNTTHNFISLLSPTTPYTICASPEAFWFCSGYYLYRVDKTSGNVLIGSLPSYNYKYPRGLYYDEVSEKLYIICYNTQDYIILSVSNLESVTVDTYTALNFYDDSPWNVNNSCVVNKGGHHTIYQFNSLAAGQSGSIENYCVTLTDLHNLIQPVISLR